MTLNEYQKRAMSTAVYPGQGTVIGLMYTALKGAGEAGEFSEKVGKAMRDDILITIVDGERDLAAFTTLSVERRKDLIKECGDELWYLAAKASELGVTLEQIALVNLEKLADRQQRNVLKGSGDNR